MTVCLSPQSSRRLPMLEIPMIFILKTPKNCSCYFVNDCTRYINFDDVAHRSYTSLVAGMKMADKEEYSTAKTETTAAYKLSDSAAEVGSGIRRAEVRATKLINNPDVEKDIREAEEARKLRAVEQNNEVIQ
ncbi:uncharacterized protein LOC144442184 [Glandiceps talaboti]